MSATFTKLPGGLETESGSSHRSDARDESLKIVWRDTRGSLRADWRFAAFQTPASLLWQRPNRPGA